jgi:predicted aldo/keto reductase-like oxidoreductase
MSFMQLRRLGRTDLQVSVVGFGTCQLRMVPETQAIDTLLRGFDLGVNIVHTAPDYEGAEDLVAAAVARTDRKVIVCSQAYDCHYNSTGPVRHFENLFEATCKRLRTDRLEIFGIACIDDREAYQENVWGKNGMIEFLQRKKEQGRLGGIFCTTHGSPEYIRSLIESGLFEAIMIAYNALGFHLLSYSPPPGRHFESLPRHRSEIFPLCSERDLGLMIMKPFAGGLLHASRAFPPRHSLPALEHRVEAADILHSILENEEVSCVLPGTSSIMEAEENARAGHGKSMVLAPESRHSLRQRVTAMQASICSRCGACDALCSQQLKVSWLFRAAYVNLHPSETYETWDEVEYFRLHPKDEATCDTCKAITCKCPYGIDIPRSLSDMHAAMVDLEHRRLIARAPEEPQSIYRDGDLELRVLTLDAPRELEPCERRICRVFVENISDRLWAPNEVGGGIDLALTAFVDGERIASARLRHEVWRGGRCHFVFEIRASGRAGCHKLRLNIHQRAARHPMHFASFRTIANFMRTFTKPRSAGLTVYDDELVVMPLAPERKSQPLSPKQPPEVERFRVTWRAHNIPPRLAATGCHVAYLEALNTGSEPWLVESGLELIVRADTYVQSRTPLPHTVAPGQCWTASLRIWFTREPGRCEWTFSLQHKDAESTKIIPEPLAVCVEIEPELPGATALLLISPALARPSPHQCHCQY